MFEFLRRIFPTSELRKAMAILQEEAIKIRATSAEVG